MHTTSSPISEGVASTIDALAALRVLDAALATVPTTVTAYSCLTDGDLVAASAALGRDRDRLDALGAVLAGEIARRSAPSLGSSGLAQRNGFRTPIEMVKIITRSTGREAVTAVRAGTLLVESATDGDVDAMTGEAVAVREPWLKPLAGPLSSGEVSIAAVDAIRAGLGTPTSVVSSELLESAASQLVGAAREMDPDGLRRLALAARDEIDAAGVAEREEERRSRRSLRLITLPDGMGRLVWTMDPETLATVRDVYDRSTSPKLGGVRFVADEARAAADAIETDPRTPEQLASDTFAHLLGAGADADASKMLGTGAPVVKVLVTLHDLDRAVEARRAGAGVRDNGKGRGYFEGQLDPVSMATVERALEAGLTDLVVFDDHGLLVEVSDVIAAYGPDWSQLIDVGRDHRLFSRKQKSDLAARDGGCRWPGCRRPPSWCEAHHVDWWAKDVGPTTVGNGILLCRHHHLLLHNGGWDIARRPSGSYELIPPAAVDIERTPRPMPSKSGAWQHLHNTTEN